MFSSGQWGFMAVTLVIFIGVIIYTYRKDLKLHKRYYKGSIYVLLGFITFMIFLFVIKYLLEF